MKEPIIYITPEAYAKITTAVRVSDLECSMLGTVETHKTEANTYGFLITDIYFPQQTRSAAFTKITHDGIAEILTTEGIEVEKIKCWIHSHVNMGVSPSGQDDSQAKELMQDAEWFIRGIFNKKNEYSLSIHWRGIEIAAKLVILWGTTLEEGIKKELEEKTVVEQRHVSKCWNGYADNGWTWNEETRSWVLEDKGYLGYRERQSSFLENQLVDNKRRIEYTIGSKLYFDDHQKQCKQLTYALHGKYMQKKDCMTVGEFRKSDTSHKKLSDFDLLDKYEEYMSKL